MNLLKLGAKVIGNVLSPANSVKKAIGYSVTKSIAETVDAAVSFNPVEMVKNDVSLALQPLDMSLEMINQNVNTATPKKAVNNKASEAAHAQKVSASTQRASESAGKAASAAARAEADYEAKKNSKSVTEDKINTTSFDSVRNRIKKKHNERISRNKNNYSKDVSDTNSVKISEEAQHAARVSSSTQRASESAGSAASAAARAAADYEKEHAARVSASTQRASESAGKAAAAAARAAADYEAQKAAERT